MVFVVLLRLEVCKLRCWLDLEVRETLFTPSALRLGRREGGPCGIVLREDSLSVLVYCDFGFACVALRFRLFGVVFLPVWF